MTQRRALHRMARIGRAALVLAAALLLAAATALPADAQARRTRPEGSSASSGSQSSGSASSGRTSSGRTAVSGSPAGRTRPSGSSSGTTVVHKDRRPTFRPGHRHFGYYPSSWSYYHWYPYRYSWWLGYWGWYGWWDYYPYSPGPYPYYGYGPYRPRDGGPGLGGLDLDLKPGDTQIYLDGQLIGTADNYDGWPRYLWLEPGDHHLIFWHQGRRPIVREYTIRPDVVIDVTDRLEPGEATPVEELFPPPTARRDARVERNRELRRRAEAEDADSWRERSARIRRSTSGEEWEGAEGAEGFASLRLEVEPADASVYLDGRFLGTADDLGRLDRGLTVGAGEHTLSVVRPGYAPEDVEFEAAAGEEIDLEVILGREG